MEIDLVTLITESNGRIQVEDLELLQRVCDEIEAKTILEIGSADGGSSVILADRAKARGGRLYCIEPKPKRRMVENMNKYGLADAYVMCPGLSPWAAADNDIPAELDLLFIDGCHYTRWALVDYHYFAPCVRPGGVIVFHDTSGGCKEDQAQSDYGSESFVPQVLKAIRIIQETDKPELIDESTARRGGAMAFRKLEGAR